MIVIFIPWLFALFSVIGVILNIQKKPSGFVFYTIANIGLVWVNIYHEIYAQAVLFTIFTVLSIYGWWSWKYK